MKPFLCISVTDPSVQVEKATASQSRRSLKGRPGRQRKETGKRDHGDHTHCLPQGVETTQGRPDSLKPQTLLKGKGLPGQGDHGQGVRQPHNGNIFLICARPWAKHSMFIILLIPVKQPYEAQPLSHSAEKQTKTWPMKCPEFPDGVAA